MNLPRPRSTLVDDLPSEVVDDVVRAPERVEWWWLGFLGMLVFQPLFDPSSSALDWAIVAAVVVIFVPLYVVADRWPRRRPAAVVATLALAVATSLANGGASVLFIYAAAWAGTFSPPTRARRWLAVATALLVAVILVSPVPLLYRLAAYLPPAVFIWVIGLATMADADRARESARLRVDNARIEHLATVTERERIARDLHDLLGHALTAVVVRAQLVDRLADTDPARAASEARAIERTAREALSAVRETVTGYRAASLDQELAAAEAALAAAGVALEVQRDPEVSPAPSVETALALALREAVTNVVRHAGASRCRVTLGRVAGDLRLQVADDGRGGGVDGGGLSGMRERIAAVGGQVRRTSDGGTVLTVVVPGRLAG